MRTSFSSATRGAGGPVVGTLRGVAGPTFRWADAADVAAVVDLVESAYRGEASRAGWTHEADLVGGRRIDADTLTAQMVAGTRVLLVETGGAIEACCALRDDGCGTVAFGMFAVVPTRQARGTGSALLGEAARIARDDWGASTLELDVIDVRAELIAWYERRGFVRSGGERSFPYGDDRFGDPFRDDLRFTVMTRAL